MALNPGRPAAPRGYADLDDVGLVDLVREGDGRALEALYGRFGRPALSLAQRILVDPQLAQDVVQEVFLLLWRDAGRFDPARGSFSSWFLSVVHHKAVDSVRKEENLRKRRSSMEVLADATSTVQVDDEVWTRLRGERVQAALKDLPAAQRDALALAYYGGYTQREIAGITDTPLGTVKTRMLAGMRKMRGTLDTIADGAVSPRVTP